MIDKYVDDVDDDDMTPLLSAIKNRQLTTVKYLIKKCKSIAINRLHSKLGSPLHLSVAIGELEIAIALLSTNHINAS